MANPKPLPAMIISNNSATTIYWFLFRNPEQQDAAPQQPVQHQNHRRVVERVIHIDPIPRVPRHHHHNFQDPLNRQDHQDHQDHQALGGHQAHPGHQVQPDRLDHPALEVFADHDSSEKETNQNENFGEIEAAVTNKLLTSSHDTVCKDQEQTSNSLADNQLIKLSTSPMEPAETKTSSEPHHNMWNSPLRRHTMLGGEAATATSRPAQ